MKSSGVVPDEKQPSVRQTEQIRHRVRRPERGMRRSLAPGLAAVLRSVERMVLAARAHAHPQRAVLQLHHGRLAAVVEPVRTPVAGMQARDALHGRDLHALPRAAVVVRPRHGAVVAFRADAPHVRQRRDPARARLHVEKLPHEMLVPRKRRARGIWIARTDLRPQHGEAARLASGHVRLRPEADPVAALRAFLHVARLVVLRQKGLPAQPLVARGDVDAPLLPLHHLPAVVANLAVRRPAQVVYRVDRLHRHDFGGVDGRQIHRSRPTGRRHGRNGKDGQSRCMEIRHFHLIT